MAFKPPQSKHARIRQPLTDQIASGQVEAGQRLPSESELVKVFGASRPTVNRALRELQLAGLIDRRAGSGSFVRADAGAHGYVFGLLIPEPGRTEIFEPICRGMADAQHGIRHVLLDRDLVPYPAHSHYDLVGVDNRRAGYVLAAHLLQQGCRRVAFVGRPGSDGFVCANDFTAAQLLRTLDGLKVSVPRDIRLVGMDDVKYASLLPVPLTTVHQPCAEIGTMAIAAMLERLRHPKMPPRDVLVDFGPVVRASCGSRSH